MKLICEYELHSLPNKKVSGAMDHGKNYIRVRPPLVRHLLRNRLFKQSIQETPCIMCVQYIGGCSVHRGRSVHRVDTMSTSGHIMSTSVRYHEYVGGCSVHWRMFSTSGFSIKIERFLPTCSPTCIMISPRCTEHPPMYSWYPPDVLNIPRCTHDIPHMHHDISRCTEHPPPDVLMVSPRCTEHPPMY